MVTLLLLLGCPTPPDSPVGVDTGDSAPPMDTDTGALDSGETAETADTAETAETGDTAPPPDDADGDGHDRIEVGGDDCDDNDPFTAPGAQEWCDDKDQDCDGDPLAAGVCGLTQPLEVRAYQINETPISYITAVRDLTGDGIDDVLGFMGGTAGIHVGTGDLAGLSEWKWYVQWSDTWECYWDDARLDVGDIDLDGYNDFAVPMPLCGGGFQVAWGPFEYTNPLTEWVGADGEVDVLTIGSAADVTGDGATDLLRVPQIDWESTVEVWLGGTRTESYALIRLTTNGQYAAQDAGDIDGDGIDDLVLAADDGGARWIAAPMLTGGTIVEEADLDGGSFLDPEAEDTYDDCRHWLSVGDWSGDGRDDLVLVTSGILSYFDDASVSDVYASATVTNDVVLGDDGALRFGYSGGVLRNDDKPAGLFISTNSSSQNEVVLPPTWPEPGTHNLSEVQHFAIHDDREGIEPRHSVFRPDGRGDLDSDGWSEIFGYAINDGDYRQWLLNPFDDIPWDDPQYW